MDEQKFDAAEIAVGFETLTKTLLSKLRKVKRQEVRLRNKLDNGVQLTKDFRDQTLKKRESLVDAAKSLHAYTAGAQAAAAVTVESSEEDDTAQINPEMASVIAETKEKIETWLSAWQKPRNSGRPSHWVEERKAQGEGKKALEDLIEFFNTLKDL